MKHLQQGGKRNGCSCCCKQGSKKKEFKIPVTWSVFDTVKVQADSLEEAYNYVAENLDEIPLGDEPNYIDGSYEISAAGPEECLIYQR